MSQASQVQTSLLTTTCTKPVHVITVSHVAVWRKIA